MYPFHVCLASVCAVRMLSLRQNKDPSFPGHAPGKDTLRAANAATKEGVNGGENRGIHERDPCRLTWAISGDFRLVVLGILLYSCVLRTKTRSKIAPWQVQRSFDRRICAKAMKSPQTIRRLLARALKMHRCKSVGQNRHVSLPCMPRKRSAARMLSLRPNKRSRRDGGHAPPQRHLKSRERGDESGGQRGRKRTNEPREVRVFAPPSKNHKINDITPIGGSQSSWNSTG